MGWAKDDLGQQQHRIVSAELAFGLGNQLFQVAAAYSFANVHRGASTISSTILRAFRHVDSVALEGQHLFESLPGSFTSNWTKVKMDKFLLRGFPDTLNAVSMPKSAAVSLFGFAQDATHMHWGAPPLPPHSEAISASSPLLEELRQLLGPPADVARQLHDRFPGLNESFAVHVRRGDYLRDKQYAILNETNYYRLALLAAGALGPGKSRPRLFCRGP